MVNFFREIFQINVGICTFVLMFLQMFFNDCSVFHKLSNGSQGAWPSYFLDVLAQQFYHILSRKHTIVIVNWKPEFNKTNPECFSLFFVYGLPPWQIN